MSKTILSILTLNVWGLKIGPWSIARNVNDRIRRISRDVHDLQPDVVAFQEVWCDTIARFLVTSMRYPYFSYRPQRKKLKGRLGNGLLVLSKFPILEEKGAAFSCFTRPDEFFANKGFLLTQIETPGGIFYLLNTHMGAGRNPSDTCRRMKQLEEMLTEANGLSRHFPIFLAGDFNFNEDSPEYSYLRSWMNSNWDEKGLDTFRHIHPDEKGHTFFMERSYVKERSTHDRDERLDYVFTLISKRNRCSVKIKSSDIVLNDANHPISDHAGLMTTVVLRHKATIEEIIPPVFQFPQTRLANVE